MTIESKKRFLINIVFAAVILAIGYIIFRFLFAYLMPLVIGVIISAMIQRPIIFLSRKSHTPKTLWAILLVLVSFSAVGALIGLLGYQFYLQMQNLVQALMGYIPALSSFFSNLGSGTPIIPLLDGIPQSFIDGFSKMPSTIITNLTDSLTTWLSGYATNIVSGAPSMIITSVVTIIATCYIAKDYTLIKAFIKKQIPTKYLSRIGDVRELFSKNLLKVGKGYLILMSITFVELSVALLIMRVNLAIPIAALIAVVDIMPVLGVGTVVLPWTILSAISGDYYMAIGLLITYLIITVVRQILEPKIISKQIGLFPLVTLLSMYVGLKLFGFFGMLGFPLILIIITGLQDENKIHIWNKLTEDDLKTEEKEIMGKKL